MEPEPIFEVIAGTYEEFVIGYKFYSESGEFKLEQSFANHSHKASVRCLATKKHLLASGGADEAIHLYDMRTRQESGILSHHSGTITWLCFTPEGYHLISCSEDGSIAITRVGNWITEKQWKNAHKGKAVQCFAVHPSNKLAFSVGDDKTLRTWNLISGSKVFAFNLAKQIPRPERMFMSPEGSYLCLYNNTQLNVFDINEGELKTVIECNSKVVSGVFINDSTVCLGLSNGHLSAYDVNTQKEMWSLSTGESRVKCVANYKDFLVTGSSEGVISVFSTETSPPEHLCSVNSSCRITCMDISCLLDEPNVEPKKKKLKKSKVITKEESVKPTNGQVLCSPSNQKWTVKPI